MSPPIIFTLKVSAETVDSVVINRKIRGHPQFRNTIIPKHPETESGYHYQIVDDDNNNQPFCGIIINPVSKTMCELRVMPIKGYSAPELYAIVLQFVFVALAYGNGRSLLSRIQLERYVAFAKSTFGSESSIYVRLKNALDNYEKIKKSNAGRKPGKVPLSKGDMERLEEAEKLERDTSFSQDDIAEELGVSRQTIYRHKEKKKTNLVARN